MGPQFTKVSSTLAKAVEYSTCRITKDPNAEPIQSWSETYGCQCQRKCPIGSKLDPATCTCKCRRHQKHGWKGPECRETFGSCQPGADSGNPGAADNCRKSNKCDS